MDPDANPCISNLKTGGDGGGAVWARDAVAQERMRPAARALILTSLPPFG
jgi:hypothetical protein